MPSAKRSHSYKGQINWAGRAILHMQFSGGGEKKIIVS